MWPTGRRRWLRRRASGVATQSRSETAPSADDASVADAQITMLLAQESIAGADAKAGTLGAASAVVVGLVGGRVDLDLLTTPSAPTGARVSAALGVAAVGALVLVTILLARVIVPRTPVPQPSRYAWPWVATQPAEQLATADPARRPLEAWSQARTLSVIALRKHRALRAAILWLGAAVLLAASWGVASTLTGA